MRVGEWGALHFPVHRRVATRAAELRRWCRCCMWRGISLQRRKKRKKELFNVHVLTRETRRKTNSHGGAKGNLVSRSCAAL